MNSALTGPQLTKVARIPLTRSEQSVMDRLRDEAAEVARLEKALAVAKGRRDHLIVKARKAGLTIRLIEQVAGVSNVRVSQIERGVNS